MNKIQAFHLLNLLENSANITQPIKPQLQRLFIPTWNDNLVLRESWIGRVVSHFEQPSAVISNTKKIQQTFAKAINILIKENGQSNLNLEVGLKIIQELSEPDPALLELDAPVPSSPEIPAVETLKKERSTAYWNQVRAQSLLPRNEPIEPNPRKFNHFTEVLGTFLNSTMVKNTTKALNYLEEFIKKNPGWALDQWEEKFKKIKEATKQNLKIINLFQNDGISLSPEKKTVLLEKLSTELHASVASLDSASHEKKVIQFSYGANHLTLSVIFQLIKKLPAAALKSSPLPAAALKSSPLPAFVNKIILSDEVQTFENFADKLVDAFLEFNKSKARAIPDIVKSDENRQLPDFVSKALPKLFEAWLESFLKKGVLGNTASAASLIPEKNISAALKWMAKNNDYLFSDPDQMKILKFQCVRVVKQFFISKQESYGEALLSQFRQSQNILSPFLMEILDIDHLMSSGPVWLEFEKNPSGTYNVTIYSLGNALNLHPIDPKTGKPYIAMRILDVKKSKLNYEFFYNLLQRHVASLESPVNCTKVEDLYNGPLKSLGGTLSKNFSDDPQDTFEMPSTDWQLCLSLLLKQPTLEMNSSLEVILKTTIDLCSTLMKDGQLHIPNIETCQLLEKALNKIKENLGRTKSHPQAAEIKATCREIRHAIFQRYEILEKYPLDLKLTKIPVDKDLLKAIRDFIAIFPFTQKQLQEYRGMVSWIAGEEAGKLIDYILAHWEYLFPEDFPSDNGVNPHNFLNNSTLYASIARKVLNIALLPLSLAYKGFKVLFNPFNLDEFLLRFLPPGALQAYQTLKWTIFRKTSEFIFAKVLKNEKLGVELKSLMTTWQQMVENANFHLQSKKTISFELSTPLPPSRGEVKVPLALFENSLSGLANFCPLTQIECKARQEENFLSKILLHSKLSFDIKPDATGSLEAASEQFPDFFLAKNQAHVALTGIPSYLILENHAGKKKVLIPKGQYTKLLNSRLVSIAAGPFSNLILEFLNKTPIFNSDEYFCYDIENCLQTREGTILTSSEPEGCSYLLCLYFLLNNKKALKQTDLHFKWLCNIKPFPNTVWGYLFPLALIPFNIAGIKSFRRQLFSAVSQNRSSYEKKQSYEQTREVSSFKSVIEAGVVGLGWVDLILGLTSLLDLEDLKNRNPREHFSLEQEYFLYKFAFEKITASFDLQLLKELELFKKFEPIVKEVMENGGIETLMESFGVAGSLSKRFSDIKKILGIKENLIVPKTLAGIINTSSNLPSYIKSGNSPEITYTFKKWAVASERTLVALAKLKTQAIYALDLDELYKTMNPDINALTSIKAHELTPAFITIHFPALYHIAKNGVEFGPLGKQTLRKQLIYALTLIKGMRDNQSRILIQYLDAVLTQPEPFSESTDLVKALVKIQIYFNVDEHDREKKADIKRFPEWHAFFQNLNYYTFENCLGNEAISPFLRHSLCYLSSSYTANNLSSLVYQGSILPSSVLGVGIGAAVIAMKSLTSEKIFNFSRPLFQSLHFTTTPLNKNLQDESLQRIDLTSRRVLSVIGLIMLGNYMLSSIVSSKISPYTENEEAQSRLWHFAYQALTAVGATFLRIGFAKATNQTLTLKNALQLPTVKHFFQLPLPFCDELSFIEKPMLVNAAAKGYAYAKPRVISWLLNTYEDYLKSLGEEYVEPNVRAKLEYSNLAVVDQLIHAFLGKQFVSFFEVDETSEACPFVVKKDTSLLSLYIILKRFHDALAHQAKNEKKSILNLFNSSYKFGPSDSIPLSMKQIYALIDKGNIGSVAKQAGLTNEELTSINLAVAGIGHKKFRLKQIEKLMKLIVDFSQEKNHQFGREKLQPIAIELRASKVVLELRDPNVEEEKLAHKGLQRRSSELIDSTNLAGTRSKLLRKFLQYQANSKTLYVSVATFAAMPIAKIADCNRSKLPISISPKQESQHASLTQLHKDLWNIFGTRSHFIPLQTSREMDLNVKTLQALLVSLEEAFVEKEPLHFYYEDLQALQTIFFERMYRFRCDPSSNKKEDKEILILLKKFLSLIKKEGSKTQGPGYKNIDPRPLVYPLGSPKTIKVSYYRLIEACLKHIVEDPDLKDLIKKNDFSALNVVDYHYVIKPRLAKKLIQSFKTHEITNTQDFMDFVCDRCEKVPGWISLDVKLYRKISLVKGILNHLLPMHFTWEPSEKRGPSVIPYETLFNQGLALASTGINETQGRDLATKLEALAQQQIKRSHISSKQTYLKKVLGKTSLQGADCVSLLQEHPYSYLFYMRYFLWQQMTYPQYAILTPQKDVDNLFDIRSSHLKVWEIEPKQEFYNKILEEKDEFFEAWMSLYDEYGYHFISQVEDDPAILFGFTTHEAKQADFINPLSLLGLEVQVELTQKQIAEINTLTAETDNRKNKQRELPEEKNFFKEWDWPATANPATLDWLKFSFSLENPNNNYSYFARHKTQALCPFYKVQDLLLQSKDPLFSQIAFKFDSRLWMTNNFIKRFKTDSKEAPQEIGSSQQCDLEKVLIHLEENNNGTLKITHLGALSPQDAGIWDSRLDYVTNWENNPIKVILWNASSNEFKGYPFPENFKEDQDFKTLITQLKFLNGSVKYTGYEKQLERWIKKKDVVNMEKAFTVIHRQREMEDIEGNAIDDVFIALKGLNYADLL
jgi:hypothetical protein